LLYGSNILANEKLQLTQCPQIHNNKIKLHENSVRDQNGHVYEQELISTAVREVPVVSKMSSASTFQVGEDIAVRVNKAETVYLIRSEVSFNTLYDVENEVVAQRAVKVAIDASRINQDVNISTAGLAPGSYSLMIWASNSIPVTIEAPSL
jgi:hypothetical protein